MSLDVMLKDNDVELYSRNITQNVGRMAQEAQVEVSR